MTGGEGESFRSFPSWWSDGTFAGRRSVSEGAGSFSGNFWSKRNRRSAFLGLESLLGQPCPPPHRCPVLVGL